MQCAEYYLAKCEMEIFMEQTSELCSIIIGDGSPFDLIELGVGDASKSIHLLNYLSKHKIDFTYIPIDISSNIISYLATTLPLSLPSLQIVGLNGEYFDMLKKLNIHRDKRRQVILFLGSNIGNVDDDKPFCQQLRLDLGVGDLVIMGFDLKKNPKTILDSYDDVTGLTKRFVLNLLDRINRELNGNFISTNFDYYPTYDPETGSSKGYLISLINQQVIIGDQRTIISFEENEYIYTGISQKYTIERINGLASQAKFKLLRNFFDSKKWFVDSVWIAE